MDRIYSATYSNVPVFEFVTTEGLVMRRKLDLWINATHILKVAKFPKAKRTRILEKDVQTRTHVKVQGGYGKYQGTYVPLDFGEEIAKNFGIYDELKPIFEFVYEEGRSKTPPPAPKHSHALAQNAARKQASLDAQIARKTKSMSSLGPNLLLLLLLQQLEPPRKRGRPRRKDAEEPEILAPPPRRSTALTLQRSSDVSASSRRRQPAPEITNSAHSLAQLSRAETTPILKGPSIGTFNNQLRSSSLLKQDDQALRLMVTSLNVRSDDLEPGDKSLDEVMDTSADEEDGHELLSGNELFGSPRNSFEKLVSRNGTGLLVGGAAGGVSGGTSLHDPYGLSQYHTQHVDVPIDKGSRGRESNEYFNSLLAYFLEEFRLTPTVNVDSSNQTNTSRSNIIPPSILSPPHPLSKIGINQPVDNEGNTILHWACAMANTQMIEFLLITFNQYLTGTVKNKAGETPLMFSTRFSNSYTQKNFNTLLDLLFELLLLVDNSNRTVLHHIALSASRVDSPALNTDSEQTQNYKKNKEKFARYYLDILLDKIIERNRTEILPNFINHQDVNGNTAFHIVAYNLNKRLIKVFITYHKYVNFSLKNLVNYTVEEYLASHNFVLRLGTTAVKEESIEKPDTAGQAIIEAISKTNSKIGSKLADILVSVENELVKIETQRPIYAKLVDQVNHERLSSQKDILKFFRLDHLLDGATDNDLGEDNETFAIKRNQIIQDEISRLVNDLTFEVLKRKEELLISQDKCLRGTEILQSRKLSKLEEENKSRETKIATDEVREKVEVSILLQKEIYKRRKLTSNLILQQKKVPIRVDQQNSEEFKENVVVSGDEAEKLSSIVAQYPKDDKLWKYCKLISLCCGMNFNDVERMIDLIEQSLAKGGSGGNESK